jgi:hypothetical protein
LPALLGKRRKKNEKTASAAVDDITRIIIAGENGKSRTQRVYL